MTPGNAHPSSGVMNVDSSPLAILTPVNRVNVSSFSTPDLPSVDNFLCVASKGVIYIYVSLKAVIISSLFQNSYSMVHQKRFQI